eukprot:870929_1
MSSQKPNIRRMTTVSVGDSPEFMEVGGGSFTSGMDRKNATSVSDETLLIQASIGDYSAFLLDMDGVLHRHHEPIEGALRFLTTLKQLKLPFLVLTNECRYTNKALSDKLIEIFGDVAPTPDRIYSSANSSRDFFKRLIRHGFAGSTYVVGEVGLLENIRDAYNHYADGPGSTGHVFSGLEDVPESSPAVEYVLIGSVNAENTRYVERAGHLVSKGARLLYTCPDYYDTYPDGRLAFGMPMTTIDLLEKCVGASGYNLGKPNPHMIRMAQDRLLKGTELQWKDVLFVGDSINTDIRTSIENGIDCCLVMSGCTDQKGLKRSPLQPNYVFENVGELIKEYLSDANSKRTA